MFPNIHVDAPSPPPTYALSLWTLLFRCVPDVKACENPYLYILGDTIPPPCVFDISIYDVLLNFQKMVAKKNGENAQEHSLYCVFLH